MPSYAITGTSRGIGLEFVKQLSTSSENTIFAIVRNEKSSEKLHELAKQRTNIHILEADIVDVPSLKSAVTKISAITDGILDVLINNAALLPESVENSSVTAYSGAEEGRLNKDIIKSVEVNVLGVINVTSAFLSLLRKGVGKKVITLSTGIADLDFTLASELPAIAPYCISKAATNMVIAKYAVELKQEGFTFVAISPGLVDTSTRLPTEKELEQFNTMLDCFLRVKPDFAGPLKPEQSVKMMLEVINRITVADTGAFISHKGNKEWL